MESRERYTSPDKPLRSQQEIAAERAEHGTLPSDESPTKRREKNEMTAEEAADYLHDIKEGKRESIFPPEQPAPDAEQKISDQDHKQQERARDEARIREIEEKLEKLQHTAYRTAEIRAQEEQLQREYEQLDKKLSAHTNTKERPKESKESAPASQHELLRAMGREQTILNERYAQFDEVQSLLDIAVAAKNGPVTADQFDAHHQEFFAQYEQFIKDGGTPDELEQQMRQFSESLQGLLTEKHTDIRKIEEELLGGAEKRDQLIEHLKGLEEYFNRKIDRELETLGKEQNIDTFAVEMSTIMGAEFVDPPITSTAFVTRDIRERAKALKERMRAGDETIRATMRDKLGFPHEITDSDSLTNYLSLDYAQNPNTYRDILQLNTAMGNWRLEHARARWAEASVRREGVLPKSELEKNYKELVLEHLGDRASEWIDEQLRVAEAKLEVELNLLPRGTMRKALRKLSRDISTRSHEREAIGFSSVAEVEGKSISELEKMVVALRQRSVHNGEDPDTNPAYVMVMDAYREKLEYELKDQKDPEARKAALARLAEARLDEMTAQEEQAQRFLPKGFVWRAIKEGAAFMVGKDAESLREKAEKQESHIASTFFIPLTRGGRIKMLRANVKYLESLSPTGDAATDKERRELLKTARDAIWAEKKRVGTYHLPLTSAELLRRTAFIARKNVENGIESDDALGALEDIKKKLQRIHQAHNAKQLPAALNQTAFSKLRKDAARAIADLQLNKPESIKRAQDFLAQIKKEHAELLG